jgi:hypothetical protein
LFAAGLLLIACTSALGGDECSHTVTIRVIRVNRIEIRSVLTTTGAGADAKPSQTIPPVLHWQLDSPLKKVSHTRVYANPRYDSLLCPPTLYPKYSRMIDIPAAEFPMTGRRPLQRLYEKAGELGCPIVFTLTDTD